MLFNEFISKYEGKKIDFDGAYGGQCVDLYRQYCKEVLTVPQSPSVTGAAEIWTNYLKEYFDAISNTPTGVPQKGDIVIWNKKAGGGFGHVAVFISGDANAFISFDQNWPTLSKCTKTSHDYKNVYGWLRRKKVVEQPVSTQNGVSKALTHFKVKDEDELITMIDQQLQFLKDARAQNVQLASEAMERKADYERLVSDLAQRMNLPTTSDRSDLLAAVDRLLSQEEMRRLLEKKLDQEQQKHDTQVNGLLEEITKLKAAVEKQQEENKTLLQRLEKLENRAETVQQQKTFMDSLIDIFKGLTERKK